MAKRQKYVYDTKEIPHLWAHKTQESARNKQGNLYYNGDTIYSYGSHFPIARHITHEGKPLVLFTVKTWSNTTAQHIHSVSRSIPPEIPVIPCIHPQYSLEEALKWHDDKCKGLLRNLLAETRKPSQAVAYRKIIGANNTRTEVYDAIGKLHSAILPDNAEEYQLIMEEHEGKREATRLKAEETRKKKRIADDILRYGPIEDRINAWRAGRNTQGYYMWFHGVIGAMLRITGTKVETSMGAVFPLEHAIKALPLVLTLIRNGREYHRNGHTIHLGHYAIDSIDANGTLKAGCHTITKDEIEHFAALVDRTCKVSQPSKV